MTYRISNYGNKESWKVVTRAEIDFKQSAKLDTPIRMETTIAKIKGVRLILNQNIYHQNDDTLFCSCVITLACLENKQQKPTKIPSFLEQRLTGKQELVNSVVNL